MVEGFYAFLDHLLATFEVSIVLGFCIRGQDTTTAQFVRFLNQFEASQKQVLRLELLGI